MLISGCTGGGWHVLVLARPASEHKKDEGFGSCEKEVVVLLAGLDQPIQAKIRGRE